MNFISALWMQFTLTLPFFILILLGFGLVKIGRWPKIMTDHLTRFTFSIAIPIMLFRIMSRFSQLPIVDYRLLYAFFGSCIIVFIIGLLFARKIFKLGGAETSIFAIGGIYSNNVFVGIPIAKSLLGDEAIPCIALIVVFNALILWTLVTVSIEWTKMGKLSLKGFQKTLLSVFKNPIIIGIFAGLIFSYTGIELWDFIDKPTEMISDMSVPLSLIVLGMGLAEYKITEGLNVSLGICFIKLAIQPLVIWLLAIALGLPPLETNVVVLLGSMSLAVNVYLMARQFGVLQASIASCLIISTALSSITTPLILAIIQHL